MQLCILCATLASSMVLAAQDVPSILPNDQDIINPAIRVARGEKFRVRGLRSMIDPTESGAPPPITFYHFITIAELPSDSADTIIVGEIAEVQPFLTSDGKGLYTEYTARVLDSVKGASGVNLTLGSSMTILRGGGRARLRDGRVVSHFIKNDVVPSLGRRYLFFLSYDARVDGFTYTKFWLIDKGVLRPMFPDDIARESRGASEQAGRPLSAVISFLRSNR